MVPTSPDWQKKPCFSSIVFHSAVFLMLCFFLTENLKTWFIWAIHSSFKYHKKNIFVWNSLTLPAFCVIFPDFSSLFKIARVFPLLENAFSFSRFSNPSGNLGKRNFKQNKNILVYGTTYAQLGNLVVSCRVVSRYQPVRRITVVHSTFDPPGFLPRFSTQAVRLGWPLNREIFYHG